jgi:flagellar protein FliS
MAGGALSTYKSVDIGTADPATLIVQLFDGALRFLRRARHALDEKDYAGFAEAEVRAHAIIAELSNVLDREQGGEVAANLDRLYDFMLRHLTEGLAQRSAPHLDRVAGMLVTLRDAFDAARQQR